jgi:membrane associated rhomboid family serine protease
MVGASGVVFAFLGLWLYCAREDQRRLGQQARSITSVIIGLVIVHLLLHVFTGGMIAWQAHLGGFLAGFFVMPWVTLSRRRFGS